MLPSFFDDLKHVYIYLTGGEIPWDYIYGLFEQAVYGGRVDNPVD
ncbi:unnamed protein product, partial [Rotaria magnacalcarata]